MNLFVLFQMCLSFEAGFLELNYYTLCTLTHCLLVLSTDNLCKQFGPRSCATKHHAQSESNQFYMLVVILIFIPTLFKKKHYGDIVIPSVCSPACWSVRFAISS